MSKYNSTQAEQIQKIATYLQEQRFKQGLSLEQIASMTFIRLPMLQILESAKIEQLPELVYVQEFIRRYGEALKIDGNSLSHQITVPPMMEENISQEVPATLVHKNNTPSLTTRFNESVAVKSKPHTFVHLSEETSEPSRVSWVKPLQSYWIYLVVLGGAIAGLFYVFFGPPATEETGKTPVTQTVTKPVLKNQ